MKNRRFVLLGVLLVLLAACLLVIGCGGTTSTSGTATAIGNTTAGAATTSTATSATTKTVSVKVGLAAMLTGQLAKYGQDSANALNLAVDEFNASQSKIRVSVEPLDDASDPAKAATLAQKAASDDTIVGIVGPMQSTTMLAALPVYETAVLPVISASASMTNLSAQGYKVFHRVCPIDDAQGTAIATFLVEDLKVKRVFMTDDKGAYSVGLGDQIEKELKRMGVTDIQRTTVFTDDKDFAPLITKVMAFQPDVFLGIIPSAAQYAAVAKQMVQQFNYHVQLMGTETVKDTTEFITNAGGSTEGAYCTSLGPLLDTMKDPKTEALVKAYKDKGWELSMFSGQSYEAANIMLDAISRAYDATNGTITRQAVLDALNKTDYTGVLGIRVQFTPQGDMTLSGVNIIQVKNGQFVQVKAM